MGFQCYFCLILRWIAPMFHWLSIFWHISVGGKDRERESYKVKFSSSSQPFAFWYYYVFNIINCKLIYLSLLLYMTNDEFISKEWMQHSMIPIGELKMQMHTFNSIDSMERATKLNLFFYIYFKLYFSLASISFVSIDLRMLHCMLGCFFSIFLIVASNYLFKFVKVKCFFFFHSIIHLSYLFSSFII